MGNTRLGAATSKASTCKVHSDCITAPLTVMAELGDTFSVIPVLVALVCHLVLCNYTPSQVLCLPVKPVSLLMNLGCFWGDVSDESRRMDVAFTCGWLSENYCSYAHSCLSFCVSVVLIHQT